MKSNKHQHQNQQAGVTLIEIMFAILIVSLVLGTIVVQMSKLYTSNKKNTSVLSVNTLAANEIESLKESWTNATTATTNWQNGSYTPTSTSVTFSCATWTSLTTPPTTFGSSCATSSTATSTLKRVRLTTTYGGKTQNLYLDIAIP
ncbi:type II secretion system protein [Deinococcus roseus]|uniref:type II secretion system protein n=1 Tax=Deinococcus roseus TaxID=392414 RepID=UPI00166932C0|nr:prepilin-type N-terminal cleavage/methylation domain-containing protein [Deinococcus roseus]